jgi:hypothetical protein
MQDCQSTVQVYMGGTFVICWHILQGNPGGLMTQLILNAAASGYHGVVPLAVMDCDNN